MRGFDRIAEVSSGAVPVLDRASIDDRPQSEIGNSPAVASLPPLHDGDVGWAEIPAYAPIVDQPLASAVAISRLMAQMNPQSSRATAVTATVLSLPFLISVR